MSQPPGYLEPYVRATQTHGPVFRSLLWSSPETQSARFAAIAQLVNPAGRRILDLGCGRADLLGWCRRNDCLPAEYVGIEGVTELAAEARNACGDAGRVIVGDFIVEPSLMNTGSDLVIVSGSLNTASVGEFHRALSAAFNATTKTLVFNFLASPDIAAADYLTWHRKQHVETFARTLGGSVRLADDYLYGDATVVVEKEMTST